MGARLDSHRAAQEANLQQHALLLDQADRERLGVGGDAARLLAAQAFLLAHATDEDLFDVDLRGTMRTRSEWQRRHDSHAVSAWCVATPVSRIRAGRARPRPSGSAGPRAHLLEAADGRGVHTLDHF